MAVELIVFKRGKKISQTYSFNTLYCSECLTPLRDYSHFCPECGACFDEREADFIIPSDVLDKYVEIS